MARRKPNEFRIDGIESRVFVGDVPKQSYGRFRHSKQLAIDLEYMTKEKNKFDFKTTKLAAIQFASPEHGVLVIRLDEYSDPYYTKKLLENPDIQKIFHYAYGDCTLLEYHLKIKITNVVCTKIAAKVLLGDIQKSTSLKDLLPQFVGVPVSKEQQLSDWFAKTLSREQVEYATRDVLYLVPLYEKLVEELKKSGNLEQVESIWKNLPQIVDDEISGKHKKDKWHDPIVEYK